MRSRHAAALALVGWYLIGPPIREPKHEDTYIDDRTPYYEWKILKTFPDRAKCEQARKRYVHHVQNDFDRSGETNTQALQLLRSDCVSTDDPSLKEE